MCGRLYSTGFRMEMDLALRGWRSSSIQASRPSKHEAPWAEYHPERPKHPVISVTLERHLDSHLSSPSHEYQSLGTGGFPLRLGMDMGEKMMEG